MAASSSKSPTHNFSQSTSLKSKTQKRKTKTTKDTKILSKVSRRTTPSYISACTATAHSTTTSSEHWKTARIHWSPSILAWPVWLISAFRTSTISKNWSISCSTRTTSQLRVSLRSARSCPNWQNWVWTATMGMITKGKWAWNFWRASAKDCQICDT